MDIRIQTLGTRKVLPDRAIVRAAEIFFRCCGVKSAALSIVLMTGRAIRRINKTRLGHDFITDVITFDLTDKASCLEGEICICVPEALRNSRIFGDPVGRELLRYLAHGILHLNGHDDATPRQRMRMRCEEDRLLARVWP